MRPAPLASHVFHLREDYAIAAADVLDDALEQEQAVAASYHLDAA